MPDRLLRARQAFNASDFASAANLLDSLIAQGQATADAYLLAATIAEKSGQGLLAADHYASAIATAPKQKKEIAFRAASLYVAAAKPLLAADALLQLLPFAPDDLDLQHSLCSLYREAGDYARALPHAQHLARHSNEFGNLLNAGMVLSGLGRFEEAFPQLRKCHDARPDERLALSELFWCAANLCDFVLSDRLQAELLDAYAREGDTPDIRENAFRALMWSGDEAYLLKASRRTAQVLCPPVNPVRPPRRKRAPGEPIRIGYVSCDFYDHATMTLLADVLESHDRSQFHITGFCFTPHDKRHGAMRQRFLAAVDNYVDLLDLDDAQAVDAIRQQQIDILIDLKGFTQGARPGIFCARPVAIQLVWLGFPGTLADCGIDYALTDWFVTPQGSDRFFAEQLIRLPGSYQSQDSKRENVFRTGSRADHGLPESAVVYCSFNHAAKIRSPVFAAWMQILHRVEGSVLWLGNLLPAAFAHLQLHAKRAGIDPNRLILADQRPITEHMRRLPQADIALDTSPCNGHTTTSDALWAGLPVVTLKGTSFAGRVSESLLQQAGLQHLIRPDLDAYVETAVELSVYRQKNFQVSAREAQGDIRNRTTEISAFSRVLENAFHERFII